MIKTIFLSSVLTAGLGLGVVAAAVQVSEVQRSADVAVALTMPLPARSLPDVAARPAASVALRRPGDAVDKLSAETARSDSAAPMVVLDLPSAKITDFAPAGGAQVADRDHQTPGEEADDLNDRKEKNSRKPVLLAKGTEMGTDDAAAPSAVALAASLAAADIDPTAAAARLADADALEAASRGDDLRRVDWTATPLPDETAVVDGAPTEAPIRLPGAIALEDDVAAVVPEPVAPKVFAERVVVNRFSNLRQAPTVDSAILGRLSVGDKVTRTTETPVEGYHRVVGGDVQGWVWWLNIEPASAEPVPGGTAASETWQDAER